MDGEIVWILMSRSSWGILQAAAAGHGMELQYVEPGQAVQISLEEWDEGGKLREHALAGINS